MPGRPWTLAERRQLVQLRQQGLTVAEVAQRLDRSRRAVKHVVVAEDARSPNGLQPWTGSEQRLLVQLRRAGHTRAQIAVRLGRTEDAVRYGLRRVTITFACPTCARDLPASEFRWAGTAAVPPCRRCAPDRKRRKRGRPDYLAPTVRTREEALQRLGRLEPIDVRDPTAGHRLGLNVAGAEARYECECGSLGVVRTDQTLALREGRKHLSSVNADPDRVERIRRIAHDVRAYRYALPTRREWEQRLTEPEVAGRLIRAIAVTTKLERGERLGRRAGRLRYDYVRPDELRDLLPENLARALGLVGETD